MSSDSSKPLTFAEWIDFEANNIVYKVLRAPKEHRADYMYIQIQAALLKAKKLGRQGLGDDELIPFP